MKNDGERALRMEEERAQHIEQEEDSSYTVGSRRKG